MSAPPDLAARERIRCDHDQTLFVAAGAGTGKTTALVSRVVALVATGRVAIGEVAAITFTEAAASELRDKIRDALEVAADGRDATVSGPTAHERCRIGVEQLDDAVLTTLHGFASRILGEHPLEAGLPPRFDVVDDVQAGIVFEQRWGELVERLLDDPAIRGRLARAIVAGITPARLRPVAQAYHANYDRLAPTPPAPPPVDAIDVRPLIGAIDTAIAYAPTCRDASDLLCRHLSERLVGVREDLVAATDDLDRLDVAVHADALKCANGQKGSWDDVDAVRDACAAAELARAALVTRERERGLHTLVARVHTAVLEWASERRRRGRLEFHDLLVAARDLLRTRDQVRAALSDRHRVLLLDELQDTDPLQIEIAALLTTERRDIGDAEWHELGVRDGSVFLVGDPKQSIYRFRRADLAVYDRVRDDLGAEALTLDASFRSVPGVIDWVNGVFAGLLEARTGVQAPHAPLRATRPAVAGVQQAVRVLGGPAAERVNPIRAREAGEVAEVIRRMVAEQWPIHDPRRARVRPARFSDVALLLPTRTALPTIEDALAAAGIPARIESQSLVFATAEVRDLLAALNAIDDPTDQVAVVATLRSPAFACRDDELVAWREAGGHWDPRRPAPNGVAPHHPVAAGMAALAQLHDRRPWRTVAQTVEAVVREQRVLELATAHRRPRDHWRRVRFLVDRARAWSEEPGASLRGFVEWVQQQADERARAVEVVVPERDDDAIRVLTIHGAKGLEFPIVVLAGLNVAPSSQRRSVIWTDTGPEVSVGTGGARVDTPGYAAACTRERDHEVAERDRLLYVATTRARDHLVVSLHHKDGADCGAARLLTQLDGARHETLTLGDASRSATSADGPRPIEAPGGDREAWLAERAAVLARAARPASIAATTLAALARGGDPEPETDDVDDEVRPPWQRGRAASARGRAVHATLQLADLATGANVPTLSEVHAIAEGIADEGPVVATLVRSVLAASILVEAAASGRYWREVPVGTLVGETIVEGFVDLLVETREGELVVVDYKTDRTPTASDLDAAVGRYRVQGAGYALAIEAALGRPVDRCVFVFARRDRPAVERTITDLPAAVAEVRALVAGLARPG